MKLEAKARLEASAPTFRDITLKDFAKMPRKEFERGYSVKIKPNGAVLDTRRHEEFKSLDDWITEMENNPDEDVDDFDN